MKMTSKSAQYFAQVASQWDNLRCGYFGEELRDAALDRAYLRPEMVAADIGAGTGFLSEALVSRVSQVHVIDGSEAMLAAARQKLAGFSNVVFHRSDGDSLDLPDGSVDAAFANMYLHHVPDPQAAITEMARILRPGGRLVITDMDPHPYEWLKEEMADEWMGFEHDQMRAWLRQAGLVNVYVTCTGQNCCAEAKNAAITDPQGRTANISIFVAVGTRAVSEVHQEVGRHYASLAEVSGAGCCSSSASADCCDKTDEAGCSCSEEARLYSAQELASVPAEAAEIPFGCGNPTAFGSLQEGETVLDIGSGGGLDAFLAARKVGSQGRVFGVDMTPAMIERARRAAEKGGYQNVEFRLGQAEELPLEDASVDVVLSNCVINLTEDKGRVFNEAYRVLREGGRLEVSDAVADGSFPLDLRNDPAHWGSCIFGALPEREYLDLIAEAGFNVVKLQRSAKSEAGAGVSTYALNVSAVKGPAPAVSTAEVIESDSVVQSCGCGSGCCS